VWQADKSITALIFVVDIWKGLDQEGVRRIP